MEKIWIDSGKTRAARQKSRRMFGEAAVHDDRNSNKFVRLEGQGKRYDLEERTATFAERVRDFCFKLPKNSANNVYIPQLLRAGSSPGSNYIEANENPGEKDFQLKIKTCRRESKETAYWLRLITTDRSEQMENERLTLRQEAKEWMLIFSAILKNRENR